MNDNYKPVLFELKSTGGIALSPWCWHVRMAMAHKGVEPEIRQHGFTDKAALEAAGGKTFPFMREADGAGFDDSVKIVLRLEERVPKPTLFPGGDAGLATYHFLQRYTRASVVPSLVPFVVPDIPSMLDGEDLEYFVSSRESRFGMKLEELAKKRDAGMTTLDVALEPFRGAMRQAGFIGGDTPAMGDYLLFGPLQWARVSSLKPVLAKDDPVAEWMEKMLDMFGGLGRSIPARAG